MAFERGPMLVLGPLCDQIAHMEGLYGTGVYGMMSGMETGRQERRMPDFKTMDPREFVRGLMVGDSREFKLGYTAANATLAVARMQSLSDGQVGDLLEYAEGFAYGMKDFACDSGNGPNWMDGYNAGQDTDCMIVNPG